MICTLSTPLKGCLFLSPKYHPGELVWLGAQSYQPLLVDALCLCFVNSHFTYLTSVCPWMCSDSIAEPKWQPLSSLGSPCHTRHKISHPATALWKCTQLSNATATALPEAGTLLSLWTRTVNNLSPPCPLWDSRDNGTGRSGWGCFWLSFNLWSLRGVRRKLS